MTLNSNITFDGWQIKFCTYQESVLGSLRILATDFDLNRSKLFITVNQLRFY